MEFKKGYIYPVSEVVFEYIKAVRGFEVVTGIGSKEIIDFPKPKKENIASSYVDTRKKGKK